MYKRQGEALASLPEKTEGLEEVTLTVNKRIQKKGEVEVTVTTSEGLDVYKRQAHGFCLCRPHCMGHVPGGLGAPHRLDCHFLFPATVHGIRLSLSIIVFFSNMAAPCR